MGAALIESAEGGRCEPGMSPENSLRRHSDDDFSSHINADTNKIFLKLIIMTSYIHTETRVLITVLPLFFFCFFLKRACLSGLSQYFPCIAPKSDLGSNTRQCVCHSVIYRERGRDGMGWDETVGA